MKYNQLLLGILIGIISIGLISGAYYLGTKSQKPGVYNTTPQVTIIPSIFPTSAANEKLLSPTKDVSKKGTIEGSLSFPSEVLPEDMTVCAENLISKESTCTKTHVTNPKYTYGVGYLLDVPAGEYYVYAKVIMFENYKAYYNKYVTCGIKVGCTDTTPIVVKVEDGKTVSNIDPQDWYHKEPVM